jgi:hypothetical protein
MAIDASALLYADISNARVAAVLAKKLQIALTDQASLWNHPAILNCGDLTGSGSAAGHVPFAGLGGADKMAAISDGAAATVTDLADTKAVITIARQGLARQISDLANLTDSVGLDIDVLVSDMAASASMRFTEMICGLLDNFSTVVGTTTVDMDVDDFFSAQFSLTQASVPGPYLGVLYPVQLTDLQNSLRGEAGAIQFKMDAQDLMNIKGQGYAGSLNGVELFSSSLVPTMTTGADSGGAIFGVGALGYMEGRVVKSIDGTRVDFGPVHVGIQRDEIAAYQSVVGSYYVGVAELEDARGVTIKSDR